MLSLVSGCNPCSSSQVRESPFLELDFQTESNQHFAAPGIGHSQGAAVQFLGNPSLLQGRRKDRRSQRASDMWTTFAPVEACKGKAAA